MLPLLGAHDQRAHSGESAGGDVTFAIDAAAEELLERFVAERAPGVAFYSEDRGLVGAEGAHSVLVVDPIDGTRPALAGLESCCVSIAAAPLDGEPCFRDVTHGCVVEIKTRPRLPQRRARVRACRANERVDRMFWAFGFRGRPARELVEVLADLIDASSVGGAVFDLGSSAFNMTRVITGQLDAVIEPEHAHLRRAARAARGVRARRRRSAAHEPAVRPGGRVGAAPGGGRGGDRRARPAARRPPAARLRPGAPDVVRRLRERAPARGDPRLRLAQASSVCARPGSRLPPR